MMIYIFSKKLQFKNSKQEIELAHDLLEKENELLRQFMNLNKSPTQKYQ